MSKGFTITCNNCGGKIDAITWEGDRIAVVNSHWYDSVSTEIECLDCGNIDKDDRD